LNTGKSWGEAQFLKGLRKLDRAISIPTRPPSERWVKPAKGEAVNFAYRIFSKRLGTHRVELLTRYEGDAFSSAGDVKEDPLGILVGHPMRIGAVKELLEDSGEDWWVVEELLRGGEIVKVEYEGNEYYMRKISKVGGPGRTWDLHSIMVIYISSFRIRGAGISWWCLNCIPLRRRAAHTIHVEAIGHNGHPSYKLCYGSYIVKGGYLSPGQRCGVPEKVYALDEPADMSQPI